MDFASHSLLLHQRSATSRIMENSRWRVDPSWRTNANTTSAAGSWVHFASSKISYASSPEQASQP